eukprot:1190995-Prorocentrum_minimum.AAC.2
MQAFRIPHSQAFRISHRPTGLVTPTGGALEGVKRGPEAGRSTHDRRRTASRVDLNVRGHRSLLALCSRHSSKRSSTGGPGQVRCASLQVRSSFGGATFGKASFSVRGRGLVKAFAPFAPFRGRFASAPSRLLGGGCGRFASSVLPLLPFTSSYVVLCLFCLFGRSPDVREQHAHHHAVALRIVHHEDTEGLEVIKGNALRRKTYR